jgi:hypothetical protein
VKTFSCCCGNNLYFENTQCVACGRELGYVVADSCLYALESNGKFYNIAGDATRLFKKCKNYAVQNVCNWLIPAENDDAFCVSCGLNHIIPNLSSDLNRKLWYRIEVAKRRLVYTVLQLELPLESRTKNPQNGLAFQFLEDEPAASEFSDWEQNFHPVITGHKRGVITINISEADHSAREEMREKMNEAYRTLLGHFRHEIGHYYWSLLINPAPQNLDRFRKIFGDERINYDDALKRYYEQGAPSNWQSNFISAYASSHPWEDWAETWANYLHMVDTLETAHHQGFFLRGEPVAELIEKSSVSTDKEFEALIEGWRELTVALNELNRSMGLRDAYPFSLGDQSIEKLKFIHEIIHQ